MSDREFMTEIDRIQGGIEFRLKSIQDDIDAVKDLLWFQKNLSGGAR